MGGSKKRVIATVHLASRGLLYHRRDQKFNSLYNRNFLISN